MSNTFCLRFLCRGLIVCAALLLLRILVAAEKKDARVTQIVHDVRVLASRTASRPAAMNETVVPGAAVRTGNDSRAELTFDDQSLTRLGANTLFTFGKAPHEFDLDSGALLLCVPPEAGSARVSTPAVSAAISGGINMSEYHKNSWTKFIVIEGRGVATLKSTGETLVLLPGQMITLPPHAKHFTKVQNIDLKKLVENSMLIKFAKLPSWVSTLINAEIRKQQSSPPAGGYIDMNGFDAIDQRAAAFPTPEPTRTRHPSPPPTRR